MQRGMENLAQEDLVFSNKNYDLQMIAKYEIKVKMNNLIAFTTKTDPDTMYYHQAIHQSGSAAFVEVMIKEINTHVEGIFAVQSKQEIDQDIKDLRNAHFNIKDKVNIEDYLGTRIDMLPGNRIIYDNHR
eukprot:7721992-Ditylum_brightwellii.AAC.1